MTITLFPQQPIKPPNGLFHTQWTFLSSPEMATQGNSLVVKNYPYWAILSKGSLSEGRDFWFYSTSNSLFQKSMVQVASPKEFFQVLAAKFVIIEWGDVVGYDDLKRIYFGEQEHE